MFNKLFSPRRRSGQYDRDDEAEAPAANGACPNGRCQLKDRALAPATAPCPNGVAHAQKGETQTETAVFALG